MKSSRGLPRAQSRGFTSLILIIVIGLIILGVAKYFTTKQPPAQQQIGNEIASTTQVTEKIENESPAVPVVRYPTTESKQTSTFSIVSPNGGESLKVGRSFTIRWNSDGSTMGGNGNNVVTVSLTPQNLGYKDERQFGIANVKASDLSYIWTPPASLSGDSYRIRATLSDGICVPIGPLPYLGATCMAMANTFATDESDLWFAIQ